MILTQMTLILPAVVFLSSCSAFLLGDNCPAPLPCTCSGSTSNSQIICSNKNLREIPRFSISRTHVDSLSIDLFSNSITVVHDNAFSHLTSIGARNIDIQFHVNHIHTIEDNAFHGIENAVDMMYLNSNNLSSLPVAIGNLVNLKTLYLSDNPLRTLDSSVMSKVGRSLTTLGIGLNHFAHWPRELRYLTKLKKLYLRNVPFTHLDINAFSGLENTLTELNVWDSKFEKVPRSICNLNHLTTLHFDVDYQLNGKGSSIFEPCSENLLSVTEIQLQTNYLRTFPDVFSMFPSLNSLKLDYNQLEYIDSTLIPSNSKLTQINLNNNMFQRIPSILNEFRSLETLSIEHNNIKTIEPADLTGLTMLRDLELADNPLVYITPDAFDHNTHLQTLDLQRTNLNRVPVALTHLPNLRTLYLSGNPIQCTCDLMSYLKIWNARAVTTFNTPCASSSESIKTFITGSLQACP